jgi:hypothetical protein
MFSFGDFSKKNPASSPIINSIGTKLPFSSKKKHLSKSPSKATPKSAFSRITAFEVVMWFSGKDGFGIPFGNV